MQLHLSPKDIASLPFTVPFAIQIAIFILLRTPLGRFLVIPVKQFTLISSQRATVVEDIRLSKDFRIHWDSVKCSWGIRHGEVSRFTLTRRRNYMNSFAPAILVEIRDHDPKRPCKSSRASRHIRCRVS